jgi:hypothetical protein
VGVNLNILNGAVQNNKNAGRRHLWLSRKGDEHIDQGGGGHQKNEEKVLFLGGVHGPKRDQVFEKT